MSESPAERYLVLGLRLGRHVDGLVDGYNGPPELATAVESEALAEPAALVAGADALLAELADGWLRDQVGGLRACAGVLAGEALAYADEVEACYGVRPTFVDERVFAEAHRELEALLPGDGSLARRHERWKDETRVPPDLVEPTLVRILEAARRWTRGTFGLPEGESVEVEIVHDVPWMAFCEYLGGLRSRISVNVDLPFSGLDLARTAIHETYPGHHVEHCWKDELLVRGRGLLEETVVFAPTPQSLVAEGIATLAPELVLDGPEGPAVAAILREAGVQLDLAHARALESALAPCEWAEVNAALLLFERGADGAEVAAYLERWALIGPELAAHVLRFLADPSSRTYIVTYPAGRSLARAYVGRDLGRFRRLLTEQVRARELVAAGEMPA